MTSNCLALSVNNAAAHRPETARSDERRPGSEKHSDAYFAPKRSAVLVALRASHPLSHVVHVWSTAVLAASQPKPGGVDFAPHSTAISESSIKAP